VVVVADGALQYVPFGALPGPDGRPLAEGHEVVSAPSAATLDRLRGAARTAAQRSLAVLADPVFRPDDPRVAPRRAASSSASPLARLPFTREEAALLVRLAPEKDARAFLDFEASRATALGAELGQYRILHLATHAVVDGAHPERTGVALSMVDRAGRPQDGLLRLSDIYRLRLAADTVVLSGCETALGRDVRGEGLVGLVRGFLHAGAVRVVASLWRVDDQATSELMRRFYSGLFVDRLPAGAALRRAQLAVREDPRWRRPYYWAAFTLQGDAD
jgi:CHAT domain-containing protein